ncbi:MAG: GNAT family N-acetyltransferase, partial [Planctomycetales bacterium]
MQVTTTYLQMFAPTGRDVPPPRDGLCVFQVRQPSVAYYRFLYNAVGDQWHWRRCKRLTDAELLKIIQDLRVEILVLHVDGAPAGFAELDGRRDGEIEMVQFGLLPEFIGQGLGKYFLQWVIDHAWRKSPRRFWLHTCSLDHPIALSNYEKAGLAIYQQE